MSFSTFGLCPELLRALDDKGYAEPTAIQRSAIAAVLQGRDFLGLAQTGSGKTAAFVLPVLQQLAGVSVLPSGRTLRKVHALVLVPTRELAVQVGETMVSLARFLPRRVKVAVLFGGVSANPQMLALRGGADVVVATPGRLLDLMGQNALQILTVQTLVLDEADRLLDMGFGDELSRILGMLPPQRQSLFFSATFPPAIDALANQLLHDPLRMEVQPPRDAPPGGMREDALAITQRAIEVDAPRRTQLLRHLVQTEKWTRVLVFVATKHGAETVADKLRKAGLEAEPFHGELSQGKRQQVLMDFKASAVKIVVATDMAARGIDIAELPVVVNYDLPRSAVDYTHRIGRTGRAGASGMAISFVSAGTNAHFRVIEKRQSSTVVREQIAGFEAVQPMPAPSTDPHATGGIKGKRPSKKDKLRATAAQTDINLHQD